MIPHGNSIKIFTGNSNPKLASDICTMVGVPLGDASLKRFSCPKCRKIALPRSCIPCI